MNRLAAFCALSSSLTACVVDDRDDSSFWSSHSGKAIPPEVTTTTIDTGAQIDVEAGTGTGIFVEYVAGGQWHIFTTCDTELTNVGCYWDVLAMIPRSEELELTTSEDLEDGDFIVGIDPGAVNWLTVTDLDKDGIILQAPPGQRLRLDALLGIPDPSSVPLPALRFVYWVGGGALNQGVPTNPIDFSPIEP